MFMEPDAPIELEELAGAGALEALWPEWTRLWRRAPHATPFQSPEWLIPWWRHFGEGDLCLLTLRSAGWLVGLAPLYVYPCPEPPQRKLMLLGTGNSDYVDLLLEPACATRGAAMILEYLAREPWRWDVAELQPLPPESPLLGAPTPGLTVHVAPQDVCPVLPLPSRVEDLPRVIPAHQLKNVRYYWRRAQEAGPVRIERADAANLTELLEALPRLHGARWRSRGAEGVLAAQEVMAFHRAAAPRLLAAGLLRLYALRLGERLIACLYGLMGHRKFYYYLGGIDPAWSRLSPGSLLIAHAIEQAIAEGAAEFDFLRGAEPYKYLWGARDRVLLLRRLLPGPAASEKAAW